MKTIKLGKDDLVEITPASAVCALGACPAIFKTVDKSGFLIIGKRVAVSGLDSRIGPDEEAFFVPAHLLKDADLGSD